MANSRKTLIAMLGFVQNSVEHQDHDIMTFAGFMSDEELPRYIFDQVKQIKSAQRLGELAFRFNEVKQIAA